MEDDEEPPDAATGLDEVAAAIRAVLEGVGDSHFSDLLDPLVSWADCAGADAVLDFVSATLAAGAGIRDLEVEVAGDRIVTEFRIGDHGPLVAQAVFIRSGRICEIVDAPDRDSARTLRPVGDLAQAAARSWRAERSSPVLPVKDIGSAVEHYRTLGFDVRVYEGASAYAFATRDDIELHLAQVRDLDPATNTSAYYLYVNDADALYAAWRLAGIGGRLVAPVDTEYGLREGAHVDPDGNLVRFGSGT